MSTKVSLPTTVSQSATASHEVRQDQVGRGYCDYQRPGSKKQAGAQYSLLRLKEH